MGYLIDVTREEKERELDRLLRSGVVREKTQLHSLLSYLGRKALNGSSEPLKEYTIGIEALGKPTDYDPRIDPTVRVEVAKLRKKLEEHYAREGAISSTRLTIPKGGYQPVFVEAAPDSARHGKRRALLWGALTGAMAAAAAVTWMALGRASSRPAPEIEAFWGPHFTGSARTLVVYGVPLFWRTGYSFYRNSRVNRPEEAGAQEEARAVFTALGPYKPRPVYHFTGVGETEAVFHVTRLLASHGADVIVQRSNSVSWEDLKGRHALFLGGRKFNPQIPDLPFKPKFEAAEHRIVNLEPQPGEPADYPTATLPPGETVQRYALISVYPGFTPGTRLITLECSSTEGTLAAAEFLTRADMLAHLVRQRLPLRPEGGRFRPFQVVIGARFNRGVVVSLFYKTHRTLD